MIHIGAMISFVNVKCELGQLILFTFLTFICSPKCKCIFSDATTIIDREKESSTETLTTVWPQLNITEGIRSVRLRPVVLFNIFTYLLQVT